MNCPLCIDQTLEITWRNGIELDICPKCRGIWLDRGEIDRLLTEDEPPPPSPAARPEAPRREPREPSRREVDDDEWEDLARRASNDRKKKSKKKPKRRKSLAERLGDAIEDVIDEIT